MKQLKSIIVVVALCFATISASAQFSNTSAKNNRKKSSDGIEIKYQGDVSFGAFEGDILTIGWTNGVKISEYGFVGLNVAAEVSTHDFGWWNLAPLASFRGYYPINEKFRVFLNPELGVSIGVAGDETFGYGRYQTTVSNSGSHFEYRLTGGIEYSKLLFGLGCGGAGSTKFFAKIGLVF